MRHFWGSVVRPVLDAVRPAAVVEIGAAAGKNTRALAAYCREHGGVVHVIDPVLQFDLDEFAPDGTVVMHTDLSLNVLPELPPVDVALIDGDHNWYTVLNELRLLREVAKKSGRPAPVAICHDACWPYGRRDLYCDPDTIPDEFRQPWARGGIVQGQLELSSKGGLNRSSCNAMHEGGPQNGVMTAVEDFVAETDEPISVSVIPQQYGLAVLTPQSRADAHPGLEEAVSGPVAGAARPAWRSEEGIPRVIHRVWLGSDPIPDVLEAYAESWKKHHRHWSLQLWREDQLPPLSRQAEFDQLKDFKTRYDIVRLEILREYGGVIIDMDMEAIRPLDPLLEGVTAFVGRADAKKFGNQILGAVSHHPFFEHAVDELKATVAQRVAGQTDPEAEDLSASQTAGSSFLTRLLGERPEDVTVFPPETFYYEPAHDPVRKPKNFPESYAVHHGLETYQKVPEEDPAWPERLRAAHEELERLSDRPKLRPSFGKVHEELKLAERVIRQTADRRDRARAVQLRQLEARREQIETRLREARENARRGNQRLKKQRSRIADLEQVGEVKDERIAELEGAAAELEQVAEVKDERIEELEGVLAELEGALAQAQEDLRRSRRWSPLHRTKHLARRIRSAEEAADAPKGLPQADDGEPESG